MQKMRNIYPCSDCKLIIDNVEDKNPGNRIGETPLHLAARKGHLSICKLILDNVQDKNPNMEVIGWTPLHNAALCGHFEVCQLILGTIHILHKHFLGHFLTHPPCKQT